MSYTPTVWKTGDVVSSAKLNKIETELVALDTDKANIDGYYESMTVGNAEQLVATVGVEDSVPFNFRTTGGSADVGDRKTMEVVGGTVAWNQLFPFNTIGIQGLTVTNPKTGTYRLNGTLADASSASTNVPLAANHVFYITSNRPNADDVVVINSETWATNKASYLVKPTDNRAVYFYAHAGTYTDVDFTPQVIDLTQMFGSTIADYIYSLEQANAGAGVAWFRKLFPKPYYAYNAGELMSVKTSGYVSTGFNQWDEDWEVGAISSSTGEPYASTGVIRSKNFCPCVPSTAYYVKTTSENQYIFWYDASKNFVSAAQVSNATATSPANACFFKIQTRTDYGDTYKNDICINLHWDGERDGEYEPYVKHTYALDSDLELRGIPKLDADNALYYDGDTYEADGTVGRRFGIVDLGSITWVRDTANNEYRFRSQGYATIPNAPTSGGSLKNILCGKYTQSDAPSAYNDQNGVICIFNGIPLIRDDAYTDADTFKTAMSGVKLVYELATPEEETADPFQTPQIVNDFGTEEFVDARTIPIPVGHNSKYQANLRAKLEMAPNSPSGDGDYIVRQASGQNTYVPITFPADELPAAPTTDGNYVLKCTVSSGTATFTWEAQT